MRVTIAALLQKQSTIEQQNKEFDEHPKAAATQSATHEMELQIKYNVIR
jgi:hypothetical protein